MATLKRDNLKRVLYPIFPLMSLAIWVGLGVDLIGAFIVLLDTLSISSQFLFNQVVVAIIVLNGAFLSGRMSEKLFSLIQTDRILPLSSKTNLIFGISGSVSIVSWLTITFIDFFSFKLSFWQFFAIYLTLIITAFFGQKVLKKW